MNVFWDANTPRARPALLKMTELQLAGLSQAHGDFVSSIRARNYSLPYNKGTRGIATTAGGSYLVIVLVSIRMLRETGSTLPVEVFVRDEAEFDPEICGKILPTLNAKCVNLDDIFSYSGKGVDVGIDRYQYKILSILFSSFEEVLFLDSDCFPAFDPEQLFKSPPFTTDGMVLWSDFWYPSESPLFFNIANIQAPELNATPSTEAGEMLYSKKKRELSLLLATYYNYHGPEYYYPLQSQGAPGEGDKETFPWAATVLGESFYRVKKLVHALGYHTKLGDWKGSAMAQFDPAEDANPSGNTSLASNSTEPHLITYPRPFFVHANYPKLDPGQIFDRWSYGAPGPTLDSDNSRRRIWHKDAKEAVEFFGYDLEKVVWQVVKEIACEYEGTFQYWGGRSSVCRKAQVYWDAVFADA